MHDNLHRQRKGIAPRGLSSGWSIFLASLLLTSLWAFFIMNTRSIYLNSRSTDALAMINVLFPFFWVLLIAYLCLALAAVFLTPNNRWLHVAFLFQIGLVLYCTPIALSSFTQNPDALWFASIGRSIPDVLSGVELKLTEYGQAYPPTFILIHYLTDITGIGISDYVLILHPVLGVLEVVVVYYAFASRFLTYRNAFVSMLFALPAIHYFQLHMSPQFVGFLLVPVIMIILLRFSRKSILIASSLMFLLVLTHPTSPLLLAVFLLVIIVYKMSAHGKRLPLSRSSLFFLGAMWVSWTIYHAAFILPGVEAAIIKAGTLNFSSGVLTATAFTRLGGGFIYPQISVLSQIIYIGQLTLALTPVLLQIARFIFQPRRRPQIRKAVGNMTLESFMLLLSGPLFFLMSYVILFVGTQNADQLLKAFVFFILLVSMQIASLGWLSGKANRFACKRTLAVMWLVFLFMSFPVISYSTSAYDVFPPSEGIGMNFIASRFTLNEEKISMYMTKQLIAYTNESQYFRDAIFPPVINNTNLEARIRNPDIIVLRQTAFFRIAMRFDMSFEDNRYTQLRETMSGNTFCQKVYSSSTLEIYIHHKFGRT